MKNNPVLKIMLLGAPAVGKTSLVNRYVHNRFDTNYQITLGVDFLAYKLNMNKNVSPTGQPVTVVLQLWDIAGQSAFSSFRKYYFRGVHGSLLVYDLTRLETLLTLPKWNNDVLKSSPNAVNVLIGNKSDLTNERKVSKEQLGEMKKRLNSTYSFETSAKTGDKVNDAFLAVSKEILSRKATKLDE